jgi:hypothetical protein
MDLIELVNRLNNVKGAYVSIRRDQMVSISHKQNKNVSDATYTDDFYFDCYIYSLDKFLKDNPIFELLMMVDSICFQSLIRRYLKRRKYFHIGCPIQADVDKYYSDEDLKSLKMNQKEKLL